MPRTTNPERDAKKKKRLGMKPREDTKRGGRAKRMVRVTRQGAIAAREFYDSVMRASQGVSWAVKRAASSS